MLEAQVATHYVRSERLGDLERRLQGLGDEARDLGAVKALLDAFQVRALRLHAWAAAHLSSDAPLCYHEFIAKEESACCVGGWCRSGCRCQGDFCCML